MTPYESRRNSKETPEALDVINHALSYDPATGVLTWKARPESEFKSVALANRWNGRFAGKKAGRKTPTVFNRQTVFCHGHHYYSHRVAWAIHHNQWPAGEIDHIDQNPSNNMMSNLRVVTASENRMNAPKRQDNKSGHTGVHWDQRYKYWVAYISINGKRKHLGSFHDKSEALAARKAAESEHLYHPNHGIKIHEHLHKRRTSSGDFQPLRQ